MPDELTTKRFDDLDRRIEALEARLDERVAELRAATAADFAVLNTKLDDTRRHLSSVEIRLSTEITTVAGLVRDLTSYLRDRDDTRARVAALEARVALLSSKPQ